MLLCIQFFFFPQSIFLCLPTLPLKQLSDIFGSPAHGPPIQGLAMLFAVCHILFIRHWLDKFTSVVWCVTPVSKACSAPEIIVPPSCVVSECGWWPLGRRLRPPWTGLGRRPTAPGPEGKQGRRGHKLRWSQSCWNVTLIAFISLNIVYIPRSSKSLSIFLSAFI